MPQQSVFILPGLYNSGPDHWQTHWETTYGFTRIQQSDWDTPNCNDWIATVDKTVKDLPLDQVILIGHSSSCCAIVKWAEKYKRTIKGALLVAPSDSEAGSYPAGTTGFSPMPQYHLPFPSIAIASSNDEYVTLDRATQFAEWWGSELINIGDYGHINSACKLGLWPEGFEQLKKLMA